MTALHIQTPLLHSHSLSLRSDRTVLLKLDGLQPTGSFKIRGIGFACQEYIRRGAQRLISSSGGNAGIAVAYAGRLLCVPVIVVVPETTSDRAKELLRQQNAEIIVHGATWHDANTLAQSLVGDRDAFLHPFDDPLLWRGHASIIDEIVASGCKPDVVVLSVGGGGLLCGVIEGLHRNAWADIPIIAVETIGTDSFYQSVQAGRRVELPAITSIATSLGARQVCNQALAWSSTHPIRAVRVSDRSAVAACHKFMSDHRLVVEPACGAALAVIYEVDAALGDSETVLVIVCGGATATVPQLQQWYVQLHESAT